MSALNVVLLGAGGQFGKTLIDDWQSMTTATRPGAQPVSVGQGGARGVASEQSAADAAGNPAHWNFSLYPFTRQMLDICVDSELDEQLASIAPQVIVNAAAYTQVDRAESEADQAMACNGDGAAAVARYAARSGCRVIHLSTDFVFDGAASRPYATDHATAPLSAYGRSKLAGEQTVLATCPERATVIRTSWLYSRYAPNFVTTMLRLMTERSRLSVVSDQVGTPTSTHSLAALVARVISDDSASGLYHWSDAGVASWYDFAVAVQELALAAGLLNQAIPITPITTADYPTPARRPAYSVLDKSTSYRDFEQPALHWRGPLQQVITELKDDAERQR